MNFWTATYIFLASAVIFPTEGAEKGMTYQSENEQTNSANGKLLRNLWSKCNNESICSLC